MILKEVHAALHIFDNLIINNNINHLAPKAASHQIAYKPSLARKAHAAVDHQQAR